MHNAVTAGREMHLFELHGTEATMPVRKSKNGGDDPPDQSRRMLKIGGVLKLVPLHRNTINKMVRDHTFPQPTRPNGTIRLWHESEVIAWRERNQPPRGPRHRQWNRK